MAVKELFWMLLVTVMATGAQLQQQSPEFPPALPPPPPPSASPLPPPSASPTTPSADDFRRSSGQSEEDGQQLTMMTLPSEDEGLVLASGQTAILECRISAAASSAGPASDGRNRNLSWTNSLTNRKMTTSDNSAFQNISLTHETSMESNETSLILTISNLTVAKSEFRCELYIDGDEDRSLQRTVKVTIISSDWFCTFEGETPCAWKIGTAWTREHSSPATNEPPSCSDGFSDHTYGKNNANGHFLIARVTGDRLLDGATLNLTGRNLTECIRFYYRTCVTNDSRGSVQLMLTMTKPVVSSPLLVNLSLTLDWAEHSLMLPPQSQEQYEIMLTFTYTNASDFAYVAIDDTRMENENCDSGNQQVTKMESIGESSSLLQVPPVSTITTNTALTNTGSSPSSTSKVASTSKISSSTTITTTQSTTSFSPTPSTTTTTTAPTTGSSPSLPPTKMIQSTVIVSRWTSLLSATTKRKPDDSEDSIIHSTTDDDRISAPVAPAAAAVDEPEDADEDEANDDAAAAAAATGDNSTGLAIGIILAIMVAGACTAAILYRRRKNGKKSTYITFGNPSYSREHLPVNDFGLDSPLTLSSNGYTVLA